MNEKTRIGAHTVWPELTGQLRYWGDRWRRRSGFRITHAEQQSCTRWSNLYAAIHCQCEWRVESKRHLECLGIWMQRCLMRRRRRQWPVCCTRCATEPRYSNRESNLGIRSQQVWIGNSEDCPHFRHCVAHCDDSRFDWYPAVHSASESSDQRYLERDRNRLQWLCLRNGGQQRAVHRTQQLARPCRRKSD